MQISFPLIAFGMLFEKKTLHGAGSVSKDTMEHNALCPKSFEGGLASEAVARSVHRVCFVPHTEQTPKQIPPLESPSCTSPGPTSNPITSMSFCQA